jgi:hypothetical protein
MTAAFVGVVRFADADLRQCPASFRRRVTLSVVAQSTSGVTATHSRPHTSSALEMIMNIERFRFPDLRA